MRIEIDKEEYKDLIETKEEFVKTVRKLENIIIENIKYKQALDEIEKIISTPCIFTINSCIECKCSSCLCKQVLNIINKAKGGE